MSDIDKQLLEASLKDDLDEVRKCLEKGAQIETGDRWGQRALHLAARSGNSQMVELLLASGAKIEAEDNWGQRALHLASQIGHLSVMELLLAKGAQIEARDNMDHDVLYYAIKNNRKVAEALLRNPPNSSTENLAQTNHKENTASPSSLDTRSDLTHIPIPNIVSLHRVNLTTGELSVDSNSAPNDDDERRSSKNAQLDHSIPSLTRDPIPFTALRIVKKLGSGGLGKVFRANHIATNLSVAVKILKERVDTESLQRELMREWETLHNVSHPNIIEVLHLIQDDGKFGYTMELMDQSLRDRMRHQKLAPHKALHIALNVVKGLQYLHDQGIAHNDLKPHNVLLRETEGKLEVKLSDFGAVSLLRHEPRSVTHRQYTPVYAAPELLKGDKYSIAADVYSFGILLNEMLSGEKPFEGKKGVSQHAVYHAVVIEQKRPMVASNTPDVLRRLIAECWSANPGDRPTLIDIRTRLEDYWQIASYFCSCEVKHE